ncbi:MAG: LamG domain-containing protein, partial [Muribaculaceae bacterium]|nr:LamG domain-containing protein [Muribaculaceae bacterium]
DGTMHAPDAVSQIPDAIAASENGILRDVWVEGYVIGYNTGMFFAPSPQFTAEGAPDGNMLLASDADQKVIKGCVNVLSISNAEIREALSLKAHPENLYKKVAILCYSIEKTTMNDYFTVQQVSDYKFIESGGETPVEPVVPEVPNRPIVKVMPSSYYDKVDHRVLIPWAATGNSPLRVNGQEVGASESESFTVAMWFNPTAVITNDTKLGAIMSMGTNNHLNQNGAWCFVLDADGNIKIKGSEAGDNHHAPGIDGSALDGTCALNEMHFLLFSVDNTNLKATVYLDGNKVLDKDLNAAIAYKWGDGYFHFASYGVSMILDEVQMYNAALTAEEAALAYANKAREIASVKSIFTFDEVVEGTKSQFPNTVAGGPAETAVYQKYTGTAYWAGGLVDNGGHNEEEAEPTFVDGREISVVDPIQYYTVTVNANGCEYQLLGHEDLTAVPAGTEMILGIVSVPEGKLLKAVKLNGVELEGESTYEFVVNENSVIEIELEDAPVYNSVIVPAGTSNNPYTFRFDDAPLGEHVNGVNNESSDHRSRNFTYSAWINIKSLATTNGVVMGNIQKAFTNAGGAFLVTYKNGKLNLNGRNATAISDFKDVNGSASTDAGTSLDEWVYISVVADQDAKTVTLYKNCQPVSSFETEYGVGLLPDESMFFISDCGANILFSDLQLWNKALTQAELEGTMYAVYAQAPEGLVAYYKAGEMEEGSTTNLRNLGTEATTPGQVITGNYQYLNWSPMFQNQRTVDIQFSDEYHGAAPVKTYTLTVNANGCEYELVGCEDLTAIPAGTEMVLGIVSVPEGKLLEAVKLNDEVLEGESTYEFVVNEDATLEIVLKNAPVQYTLNILQNEGGLLEVFDGETKLEDGSKVEEGTILTLVATADPGYEFNVYSYNGSALEGDQVIVEENVTVSAEFT